MNYRRIHKGINPYKFENEWKSKRPSWEFYTGRTNARSRRKWLNQQYKKGYRTTLDVEYARNGIVDPYNYRVNVLKPEVVQLAYYTPEISLNGSFSGSQLVCHCLVAACDQFSNLYGLIPLCILL